MVYNQDTETAYMPERRIPVNKLRTMRIQHGLSQAALAEAIGSTQECISRYENGERKPSIDTAVLLARALNCKVDDLLNDS